MMHPAEITHIQEPNRLVLAWIPPLSQGKANRTWRRVAELRRDSAGKVTLHYLVGDGDYQTAIEQGFRGHPAFSSAIPVHTQGVLESFLKRLPPRSRGDFPEYLAMFKLPVNAVISDFALLGYTGARLPSDEFALFLPVEDFAAPFELVVEVSGFRHEAPASGVKAQDLSVGDAVTLRPAPSSFDANAVDVLWEDRKIGHLPRLEAQALGALAGENRLTATIVRVNGSTERPVVRLFVAAR